MANVLAPGQAVGRIREGAGPAGAFALEPIVQALNGSYALLFRTGERGAEVEEAFCHGVDAGYCDRLRQAAGEKLLPPWLAGLAPGSVFDRAAFGSDRHFARTAFYNHVIRPEGRFHCVIATPYATGRHRYHLVVGRRRDRAEFDTDSRRLLGFMLPQVNDILRLRADLAEADAAARRVEGALECWDAPFLIVDGGASPRFANRVARHWLARGDVVHLDANGRLSVTAVAPTDRLQRAVAAVARGKGERRLTIRTASDDRPVGVVLKRIGATAPGDPGEDDVLVQLDVAGIADADTARLDALAREHGLTGRETALLERLLTGTTLREAAGQLGISYNTSRSHLRAIFDKTGLHRQGDLLRFCVTGRRSAQTDVPFRA